MLARCEMCFEGMRAVEKWGSRCWHKRKDVLRAWGGSKRGFQVFALGETFLHGMGAFEKGFEVMAHGEICFAGMGAVEKGV